MDYNLSSEICDAFFFRKKKCDFELNKFEQIAFGRVAREAPAQDANPWLDAWNLANETIEQFHRSFLSIAGVQNDAELWTKARQQFTTYEASLRSNVAQLEEEVCTFFGFCK